MMTQEEKAKRYDEALKRARRCLDEKRDTCFVRPDVIFPELTESEDEWVRKALICGMNALKANGKKETFAAIPIDDCIAWLEKQGKQPKKVSIWKHWKDGIAGNAEGKQIFLIKIGSVYSISSCLGCECDYIELSELDELMLEEKQRWQKWNEEDIKFIDMLIKEKEDALCLSCDVKESISLTYCCNALKLIKQRMKEQL